MGKGHKDKVAVFTGGAKGIGQAFAKRLAEDGAHIAVADMVEGRETVNLVEAAGRNALAVVRDVSSPDSVAAMVKLVHQNFGRADILVNCAGIYPQLDFAAMTFADWRKVLSINLDGTFLVTAAFVPGMRGRKWGRIVNLASSTFVSVTTGFAHYVASKGGIIGFTCALAGDVAADGITVNAIAPGLTPLAGHADAKAAPGLRHHGRRIHRRRRPAGDQARRGAGGSGRRAVVSHQRRRGVHDRADAQCGWRAGEVLAAMNFCGKIGGRPPAQYGSGQQNRFAPSDFFMNAMNAVIGRMRKSAGGLSNFSSCRQKKVRTSLKYYRRRNCEISCEAGRLTSSLLEESKRFLEKAIGADGNAPQAYLHASLLLAFCSLEAHINAIADEFADRPEFSVHEKGLLLEKVVRLQDGAFALLGLRMSRLEERILFLHRHFSGKALDTTITW